MSVVWTIDEALNFVRKLERKLDPEWHVALGGSVLHKGCSGKDLDIIIYPHDTNDNDQTDLEYILKSFGLTKHKTSEEVKATRSYSNDEKEVEIWMLDDKRIDIFLLS